MADAARKLMTVDEFLAWDDGTDTRYDLIEGVPVPKGPILNRSGEIIGMAPATPEHSAMASKIATLLTAAVAVRRDYWVGVELGVRRMERAISYFHADVAVVCHPLTREQKGVTTPALIVEVLSPSTQVYDRRIKLPFYRCLSSMQEILLVDPQRLYCEVHRRVGDLWATDLLVEREHVLRLESVGLNVPLDELYAGLPLEDDLGIAYGTPEA
ncbi:MAG TPA: Uma2 family endonuclease [Azospirillaceae bacterium]|nr:Uma2 family endonuclease [Azospirillaceae bacterium]